MNGISSSGIRARIDSHRPDAVPLVVVSLAVALANLPALLHLVTANPLFINAYLTPPLHGLLPGLPYIDPNAGYTTQALGHLAALDWLHGHVPWWNPYEGIGAPLAGEMQSGAFFPLTLLLAFHQGMLALQISIELISGWSAYALVRRIGVGRVFSTTGGVAFGLCGTYAWLAHAPIRPVAMLPLCLIGVERALEAARLRRPGGWRLLAVALALSVLAGFPETTLIDGIFVALWAVLRAAPLEPRPRRASVVKLAAGLLVGLGLSAPLLVAFADYLPDAATGALNGTFAYVSLPTAGLSQLVLPYSLGPIFGFHAASGTDTLTLLWGSVGGFLGVTIVAAGLVGLFGSRLRGMRLGLGGWILICLLRTYGFPPVVHLMAHIPGVRVTAFYRYAPGSWELAAIVLAVLGLDDVARSAVPRRLLVSAAATVGVLAGWAAVSAWPLLTHAVAATPEQGAHRHVYAVGSLVAAGALLVALVAGGWWATRPARSGPKHSGSPPGAASERRRRIGRLVMAATVTLEAVSLAAFPYLSAPSPTPLQTGSVQWLQGHLGTYRFVTLGPIQPNYGSYYGIAQANIVDLPAPKAYAQYVETSLDPNSPIRLFSGGNSIDPNGLSPAQALTTYLPNYESLGVRYVVEDADGLDLKGKPFPATGSPAWPSGPRLTYRDGFAEIWELPSAAPAFTLAGGPSATGCTVTTQSWDQATVDCAHPVVVTRRVGYFPGWTASGAGFTADVVRSPGRPGGLFQQVTVPAGHEQVTFSYRPPHEVPTLVIALIAAMAIAVSLLSALVRRNVRRRRPSPGS